MEERKRARGGEQLAVASEQRASHSEQTLRMSFEQAVRRMFPTLSRDCTMSMLQRSRKLSETVSFFLRLRDDCLEELAKLIEFHSYELNDIQKAMSNEEFDCKMIEDWILDESDRLWSEFVRGRKETQTLDDCPTGIPWIDSLVEELKKNRGIECEFQETTELDQCMERYRLEIRQQLDFPSPDSEDSGQLLDDLRKTMFICRSNLNKKLNFAICLWKQLKLGRDILTLYELRRDGTDLTTYVQDQYDKRLRLEDPMAHAFTGHGGLPPAQRGMKAPDQNVLDDVRLSRARMLDSLHLFPSPYGYCLQVFVMEIDEEYRGKTSIRTQDCDLIEPFSVEHQTRKYKVPGKKLIAVVIRNVFPSGKGLFPLFSFLVQMIAIPEIEVYCNDHDRNLRKADSAETYFSKLEGSGGQEAKVALGSANNLNRRCSRLLESQR
eukprot:566232-Hanusia_phi.AAC.4